MSQKLIILRLFIKSSCDSRGLFGKIAVMKMLLVVFFACSSLQAMSKAQVAEDSKQIGVHTLEYEDPKRNNRSVVVEVWYPTLQSGPYDTPKDPIWVHPNEIRDVEPSSGRHPLIMMSHGHGGDRRDRSWLVKHLVSHGYIVASVEHYGNSWRNYSTLISLRFWERSKDISFAISKLLKDPYLHRKIDQKKIGFVGYSLGGMTGLSLAGARAQNVKAIIKKLQASVKEIDDATLESIDFNEANDSFYENRIKAMVLLSPAAFIFPPQSIRSIKTPIALVVSEGDEVLPHKEHALKLIKHGSFKLKMLRDKVSHYVFLNRVSDIGRVLIRNEMQTDKIQADRLHIHKEVGEFITDFFRKQL